MSRDQVVAGREARLIDHRLEPFDVLARGVIGGRGGRESHAHLVGVALEPRHVDRLIEVPPQRPQQLDRGERVGSRDVMRDLREVADRGDAGLRHRDVDDADRRRGDAQHARWARVSRRRGGVRAARPCPSRARAGCAGTAAGMAPSEIHSWTPSNSAIATRSSASSFQRKSGSGPASTRRSRSPMRRCRMTRSGQSSVPGRPSTMWSVGRRAR